MHHNEQELQAMVSNTLRLSYPHQSCSFPFLPHLAEQYGGVSCFVFPPLPDSLDCKRKVSSAHWRSSVSMARNCRWVESPLRMLPRLLPQSFHFPHYALRLCASAWVRLKTLTPAIPTMWRCGLVMFKNTQANTVQLLLLCTFSVLSLSI